ncbi:hypothetical protein A6770_29005 [Nostoc minutum NIES-26]|uniref:Late competence development ComFB family protein n=1 Tax=Nostoc minutum NIES-26 TaxID=1844469 RepID=A0A367QIB7_9NOSO|nr:late competence development ComFB family protein [Dendronalium sp. ChiSLP03b]MDZ8208578.1 hypothetical protein [Dendronalium sp. ChiSLP03b]RCJ23859.1 hypothetical protein A6770_29005 [Nostoc minutum NIES-26]
MPKNLVNVTIPIVTQELENILVTYPHHPYQEAFAHPDLRQILMAYILNRIPNHYITVDEAEKQVFTTSDCLRPFLEQTLHIKAVIHQGIEKVLCEQAHEVNRHIPEVVDPSRVASHWFG